MRQISLDEWLLMNWAVGSVSYRQDQDITQAEYAEELGVDQTTVSRWERQLELPRKAVRQRALKLYSEKLSREALYEYLSKKYDVEYDMAVVPASADDILEVVCPHCGDPVMRVRKM